MKPVRILGGFAAIFVATAAVIVGHDWLTPKLCVVLADLDPRVGARTASPAAALLVHLIAGIFVLPLLARMRVVLALPDAGRVAIATAIAVVTLRTLTEVATGTIVTGLPVFSMAFVATGIAVSSSLRRDRKSRTRAAARVAMSVPRPHSEAA